MKKTAAHCLCRQHIFTAAQLLHLGTHHLCDTCPAGQRNDERNTQHICLSQNCLKQHRQKQRRHAEENFRCAHHRGVQPARCAAAHASQYHAKERGQRRGKQADEQRNASAVPDHGEHIAPHCVRAEPEFRARRGAAMLQVHIRWVFRDKQPAQRASEHNHCQHRRRHRRHFMIPRYFWCGLGRCGRPNADKGKVFCHCAASVSMLSRAPRRRGSMRSLITWASILHTITTVPVSIQSTISRL